MLTDEQLTEIVSEHLTVFAERRREAIRKIRLPVLIAKKNPYLFVAKQVEEPGELAEALTAAAVSSSEETMFGAALEAIAIDICAAAYGGQKSAAQGIDLEFTRDGARYLVSIKSGPSWGNSSQISKLKQDFSNAVTVLRQNNTTANIQPVNGCRYGTHDKDYGVYRKLCGSSFWELISGDTDLHARLMTPIRKAAMNGFFTERIRLIGRLTAELNEQYCSDGKLDWLRIIKQHHTANEQ